MRSQISTESLRCHTKPNTLINDEKKTKTDKQKKVSILLLLETFKRQFSLNYCASLVGDKRAVFRISDYCYG